MLFRLNGGHWHSVDLWHTEESHDPQHLVVRLGYGAERVGAAPMYLELQLTPKEVREICTSLHEYATNKGV
jgi:hypothetical protein